MGARRYSSLPFWQDQFNTAASLSLGSSDMTLARTLRAPLRAIGQPFPPEGFCVGRVPEVEPGEVDADTALVASVVAMGMFLPGAGGDVVVTPVVHPGQPHAEASGRHRNVNVMRIVALSLAAGGIAGAGHAP